MLEKIGIAQTNEICTDFNGFPLTWRISSEQSSQVCGENDSLVAWMLKPILGYGYVWAAVLIKHVKPYLGWGYV